MSERTTQAERWELESKFPDWEEMLDSEDWHEFAGQRQLPYPVTHLDVLVYLEYYQAQLNREIQ